MNVKLNIWIQKINDLTLKKFTEIKNNDKNLKNEDTKKEASNKNRNNKPKKKLSETKKVKIKIK